jgi:hypothetical protein
VVGDSCIVSFRAVPEEAFEHGLLEFFSSGHVVDPRQIDRC